MLTRNHIGLFRIRGLQATSLKVIDQRVANHTREAPVTSQNLIILYRYLMNQNLNPNLIILTQSRMNPILIRRVMDRIVINHTAINQKAVNQSRKAPVITRNHMIPRLTPNRVNLNLTQQVTDQIVTNQDRFPRVTVILCPPQDALQQTTEHDTTFLHSTVSRSSPEQMMFPLALCN